MITEETMKTMITEETMKTMITEETMKTMITEETMKEKAMEEEKAIQMNLTIAKFLKGWILVMLAADTDACKRRLLYR
jgi:hypothetical protein